MRGTCWAGGGWVGSGPWCMRAGLAHPWRWPEGRRSRSLTGRQYRGCHSNRTVHSPPLAPRHGPPLAPRPPRAGPLLCRHEKWELSGRARPARGHMWGAGCRATQEQGPGSCCGRLCVWEPVEVGGKEKSRGPGWERWGWAAATPSGLKGRKSGKGLGPCGFTQGSQLEAPGLPWGPNSRRKGLPQPLPHPCDTTNSGPGTPQSPDSPQDPSWSTCLRVGSVSPGLNGPGPTWPMGEFGPEAMLVTSGRG